MSSSLIACDPKWTEVLAQIPETLIDPRDRPRLVFTLESVAEGKPWSDIGPTGLSRPEYFMLKRISPEFRSLAKEAEKIADEIRQSIREERAHERAVDGETIPVFSYKGEQVGEYKKASDKLMEVLLRASNPAKYRESKSDSGPGKVTLNVQFAIPSRVKTVEITEGEIINEKTETDPAGEPPRIAGNAPAPAPESAGRDGECVAGEGDTRAQEKAPG